MRFIYPIAERKLDKSLKNIAIYKFQRVESALERLNQALTRLDAATEHGKSDQPISSAGSDDQKPAKALAEELSQLRGQHEHLRQVAGEALGALNAAIDVLTASEKGR